MNIWNINSKSYAGFIFVMAFLVLLMLGACAVEPTGGQKLSSSVTKTNIQTASAKDTPASAEQLLPSEPSQANGTDVKERRALEESVVIGTGNFVKELSPDRPASVDPKNDVVLNFVNADIRDVAKAVLGDMLNVNYIIASSIQGNVTLKTNKPIPKNKVISTLNAALKLNGATLVEDKEVVKIIPLTEAMHQGSLASLANRNQHPQGYGAQIVTLKYISVDQMQKMLAPVAQSGSVMPVETAPNILLLAGTEDERAAMLDVVDTFDVDWLAGMSFGFYPLKEVSAKVLTNELWEVLGTTSGPLGKTVKLVPFDRLNAILAISSQPKYLDKIKMWIEKLDVDQAPSDQKIWVYAVQNGRASDLGATLNKLMDGALQANAKPDISISSDKLAMPLPAAGKNQSLADQVNASLNDRKQQSSERGVRVIADETTNSLIIMASKTEFSILEAALKKLDIVPLQVRIEAVIAEVTLTDDLNYGVQYLFHNKRVTSVLTDANAISISPDLPGFSALITGSKISAVLDLLQSITKVNVISSPQLMVLNNQTAILQIGDQVPVATQSAVSVMTSGAPVVNSIEMKDTGVILKVTPRVNASGMVIMDVSQEISDVAKTTSSTLNSPTIQQRKITSSVAVKDGETIALGGLIKDSASDGKSGIPLLQDIPVMGSLFGDTTKSKARTELLALITPRVVRNDIDAREITDEMRHQMKAVEPLDAKIR